MKIIQGNIYAKGSVDGSNNENTNDVKINNKPNEPNNQNSDIDIEQNNLSSECNVNNSNNSNKNTISNVPNWVKNISWDKYFWPIVCGIIVTVVGGLILYCITHK